MKKTKFQIIRFSGFSKEDQNNEPVSYCRHCMGLRVMVGDDGSSYCDVCGCSSIGKTHISIWEDSFEKKFGYNYLTEYEIPYEKCNTSKYQGLNGDSLRPLGATDAAAS